MKMSFDSELKNKIDTVNKELEKYLEVRYPEIIFEAMGYSVFAGGKRLRPVLMLASCEAEGGKVEDVLPFACALEMIHTYSLIHDDLPEMDDDDFRRGRPTCHKQFNQGIAVLAGDGLLTYAFEVMLGKVCRSFEKKYAVAAELTARLSGSKGMLVGQVVDVISEGQKINSETLDYIHKNKTGGLIKLALMNGAIIAGASEEKISLYEKMGDKLGLAFQIMDDILDVTSTEEVLGKPILSDEKNDKVTYVTMYGLDKAREDYLALCAEVDKLASELGGEDGFLRQYCASLVNRVK
jgi:geranylgeranyl diphosphate synthase type II